MVSDTQKIYVKYCISSAIPVTTSKSLCKILRKAWPCQVHLLTQFRLDMSLYWSFHHLLISLIQSRRSLDSAPCPIECCWLWYHDEWFWSETMHAGSTNPGPPQDISSSLLASSPLPICIHRLSNLRHIVVSTRKQVILLVYTSQQKSLPGAVPDIQCTPRTGEMYTKLRQYLLYWQVSHCQLALSKHAIKSIMS